MFGNQIYPSDVEIIGHEFTRDAIASGGSNSGRAYDWFIGSIPSEIASLLNCKRRGKLPPDT
jgi:hypothetical protein